MSHPLLSPEAGGRHLLLGNEAVVRGALEAGVNIVTCYPGTPSSEVPDTFRRMLPSDRYRVEYAVNEKVAVEVAAGAALAGAMCLVTMKHVGVNVAADPLFTAAYMGLPGGLVLLSADDPFCHSSQDEQDNRAYARFMGLPCFEPASAQEAKDMARDALLLARELAQPVMLRTTTRVNHLRGRVDFGPLPEKPAPVVTFERNPGRFVPVPGVARARHRVLAQKLEEATALSDASPWNKVTDPGETRIGVVASGISRAYLADALAEHGWEKRVKVFELGFSWPLPEKRLGDFLTTCDTVLVLEELEPLVERDLRALAQERGIPVKIVGKDGPLTIFGEYSTGIVAEALALTLGEPLPASGKDGACAGQTDLLPGRPQGVRRRCCVLKRYRLLHAWHCGSAPGGGFPLLHGIFRVRGQRLRNGVRSSCSRVHWRFHLLPFGHHGPCQRRVQQAQSAPGHSGQWHNGHDRAPAQSRRCPHGARGRLRAP